MMSSGEIKISDRKIPGSVKTATALFKKVCEPSMDNYRYSKSVESKTDGEITLLNFQCETREDISGRPETVQFVASLDKYNILLDLQILQLNSSLADSREFNLEEGGEVFVAVAAGTLASGLLAKGIYPDQNDKVLHAIVGSLIASSSAAIAYYGFDVSKNKSFWIGVASGIIAGILKEVYDSHHRDKHTVDSQDAVATGIGGVTGAFMIRFKFEF